MYLTQASAARSEQRRVKAQEALEEAARRLEAAQAAQAEEARRVAAERAAAEAEADARDPAEESAKTPDGGRRESISRDLESEIANLRVELTQTQRSLEAAGVRADDAQAALEAQTLELNAVKASAQQVWGGKGVRGEG